MCFARNIKTFKQNWIYCPKSSSRLFEELSNNIIFMTPVDSYAFAFFLIVSPFTLIIRSSNTFRFGRVYSVSPAISFASFYLSFAPCNSLWFQEHHCAECSRRKTPKFTISWMIDREMIGLGVLLRKNHQRSSPIFKDRGKIA